MDHERFVTVGLQDLIEKRITRRFFFTQNPMLAIAGINQQPDTQGLVRLPGKVGNRLAHAVFLNSKVLFRQVVDHLALLVAYRREHVDHLHVSRERCVLILRRQNATCQSKEGSNEGSRNHSERHAHTNLDASGRERVTGGLNSLADGGTNAAVWEQRRSPRCGFAINIALNRPVVGLHPWPGPRGSVLLAGRRKSLGLGISLANHRRQLEVFVSFRIPTHLLQHHGMGLQRVRETCAHNTLRLLAYLFRQLKRGIR